MKKEEWIKLLKKDVKKFNAERKKEKDRNIYTIDLSNTNLSHIDISEAELYNADLYNVDFSHTKLRDSNLSGSILTNSVFYRTDISWVNMKCVSGTNVTFNQSNLGWSDFSGADLKNSIFRNSRLTGVNFINVKLNGTRLYNNDIDFSCFPLFCGSLDIKCDEKLFQQLAYHLCRLIVDNDEIKQCQKALIDVANKFHRAIECGIIDRDRYDKI